MHSEPSPPEGLPEGLLEQELGHSLRRVEAPAGFAESLLRRLDAAEQAATAISGQREKEIGGASSESSWLALGWSVLRFSQRAERRFTPAIAGLAAALLLILLLPLAGYLHQRHQQARAEEVAQQFSLAMRLTQAALLDAGQHIAEHGRVRDPQ